MFYLTVPFLYALIRTLPQAIGFLIAAMTIGPAITFALKNALAPIFIEHPGALVEYWWYRSPFNQMGCFASGILLYFAIRGDMHKGARHPGINIAIIVTASFVALVGVKWHGSFPQPQHIFSLSFALIGLSLAAIPWRLVVNRFTIFMGKISYSGYLIHFLALKQITMAMPGPPSLEYFVRVCILAFLTTIPIAYLSYRWIEKPAIKAGRLLIERLHRSSPIQKYSG